ncbi:MAG: ribonuclease III [Erysipelotrichaceae bacterium]|jgi:ribonuclease-3|nr:ribonuclease III [Bacilli bacterium]NLV28958.1 ribonuclease III [Erysipelotrichaceae bacterium]HPY80002.1 ribonuclease III [Bacilli bacterium]HQA56092.1 ribonuclease III [Bacilli bacterium]
MSDIKDLLNKLRIRPRDLKLYELALTHPSYNADANTVHCDYERLEYMGDAVLDFVTADLIFKRCPEMDEGQMSKFRSYLVKSQTLADYARKLNLSEYIRAGHSIQSDQINKSNKILENVFEALIGAIYLDCGIKTVYRFIIKIIQADLKKLSNLDLTDAKTMLQEQMQAEHRDSVHYELVSQKGPAHERTFIVNVLFNNIVLATGEGKSKKAAEENAARKALEKRSV